MTVGKMKDLLEKNRLNLQRPHQQRPRTTNLKNPVGVNPRPARRLPRRHKRITRGRNSTQLPVACTNHGSMQCSDSRQHTAHTHTHRHRRTGTKPALQIRIRVCKPSALYAQQQWESEEPACMGVESTLCSLLSLP